ncbi:MAG: PorV/PorQ family protein [Flavobacteriales bacterium]|nr:PorV/PorQ family protein [Flavobacteriales bacterium]MCB9335334.1 PorV/PorQ family protein [Flavobacteriales bacterium]
MRGRVALIILSLASTCVFSQTSAPKYSNEFLSIGVGARALGMSNSQVSTVSDVTSGYWNPAGLTGIEKNFQIGLMHSEYFAGIAKYDYGAFAAKIDSVSAFSVSVIRFGVDDIPNTTQLIDADGNVNYDKISSFSVADYGFLFSYARKSKIEGLRYGANAKIIYRKVGDFASAWGFGIDGGAQYQYKGWDFGLMARDVTSTFNAWSYTLDEETIDVFEATGNEIPENSVEVTLPKVILGVAKNVKISNKFNALGEINFDLSTDGKRNVLVPGKPVSIDPHMGVEVGYINMIFLRLGVGNFQKVTDLYANEKISYQPNFGVGVKFKGISIDYALSDIGNQSEALYSNIFSLKFDINKTVHVKERFSE